MNNCPKCASENIDTVDINECGESIECVRACMDCGVSWVDIYVYQETTRISGGATGRWEGEG